MHTLALTLSHTNNKCTYFQSVYRTLCFYLVYFFFNYVMEAKHSSHLSKLIFYQIKNIDRIECISNAGLYTYENDEDGRGI